MTIKILHIIPRFTTGGAEKLLLEQLRYFDTKKYEMHVASCVEDGELRGAFEGYGAHVFVGSRKRQGGRLGAFLALKKYVRSLAPEIIHTHLLSSDFFGFLFKRFTVKKTKWIVTLHNVEHQASWLRKSLWKFILPHADRVVAVSESVFKYAVAEFGVKPEKMVLIYNGINLQNWLAIPNENIFSQKKIRLATIGRLEKQKGHEYLLRALARLENVDWSLEMYGEGSLEFYLQKLAGDLKISDRISWCGVVNNLPEKLERIDVIIQSSLWEGLSLVVMEAMAAGRVVVASTPAGEELIEDICTGFIAPPGSVESLTKVIHSIVNEPELAKKVAVAAREYAKDNFDLKNNVRELQKIYL